MAFSIGETLQADKYRLHALLDQHPWGQTFLATHRGIDQQVVIKTLETSDLGPARPQLDAYLLYAKKLKRFHHPNLSRVISVFEEANQACMVSEYIQGAPISPGRKDHPLDEYTAVTYLRQIAKGLHGLHRHGLLHLNLAPSRILIRPNDGKAVLIGLNSRFASVDSHRKSNPYFSIEQHQSPPNPNVSSEIYNLAAVLYHLVTGVAPTPACDRAQSPLVKPRTHRPELSADLEIAILSGMAMNPSDRPQRVKDWLQQLPTPSKPDPPTKLQEPSAWHVKLPAFQDAGIHEPVTTVLQPPKSRPEKTTLQPPSTTTQSFDQIAEVIGNTTGISDPAQQPTPEQQSNQNFPTPTTQTTDPNQGMLELDVSSNVKPVESRHSEIEVSTSPEPTRKKSYMPAFLSQKKASRFPKWTLFWCSLLAAFGGLVAGLWFRIQLTQQFAMPPTEGQTSPLDQLKSLDKKQEEFLPTKTTVIPEEPTPEDNSDGEYNPTFGAPYASDEDAALDPEREEQEPIEAWQETPSWSRPESPFPPQEAPISEPNPTTSEIDRDREFSDPINLDSSAPDDLPDYESSPPYVDQSIEQPLEAETYTPSFNETDLDSVTEETYSPERGAYIPNSGTTF